MFTDTWNKSNATKHTQNKLIEDMISSSPTTQLFQVLMFTKLDWNAEKKWNTVNQNNQGVQSILHSLKNSNLVLFSLWVLERDEDFA